MSARVAVKELLETFGNTYGAIDIRTAAILADERWMNALTVVRFTYEEPTAAAERLRSHENTHGKVETKHLRIVTSARPFSEWKNLCEELAGGALRIGGLDIKLRQGLVLDDQTNQLQAGSWYIRPFDGTDWPTLDVKIGEHQQAELLTGAITREVSSLGYSDAYEAINARCDVNVRTGQAPGFDFLLSAPVFICVAAAHFTEQENQLCVTVRRHHGLTDIKGVVVHRGQQTTAGQPDKARQIIGWLSRSEEGSPIETASASVELADTEVEDWVDVKLTHPELGELAGYFSRPLRLLIPQAERNILFEALKCFCPEAEIQKSLVRAYEEKPKSLKSSAAFELRVAWLLGLFGCSTAILGEYEYLVVPESKVRLGSVDILALALDKRLLLVGCSLSAPDEKDLNNLRNVRTRLQQTAFKDTNCRISPVFFTAATGCPPYKEHDLSDFTPIVNAEGIDTLFALLRAGCEKDFFSYLSVEFHKYGDVL